MKIYNVLTGKKEEFKPQDPKTVKMYACGITVSSDAHVGHAYQAAIFDMVRNYLEFIGYKVIYVRNYTDVDDKIIINARNNNVDPISFAEKYINKTNKELEMLGVKAPTIQARATESIQDIINFIEKLIETNHAYSTKDGNVYFRVSSFPKYGEFSHQVLDETLTGVRKALEVGKEDDRDFALWKTAGDDEIYWESPWGKGRPGWHIECSTMSMKYLGETLDIHGGGKDLKFPHHENEIAQSESLTGKTFSNYWMHNGLVKINGQKMSKSLGNGIILEDLLKEYNQDVIKLTLLQNNYRSDLNIVDGIFEQNEQLIYNFYKLLNSVYELKKHILVNNESDVYKEVINNFKKSMDNDFNTSSALSYLYGYLSTLKKYLNKSDYQSAIDMTQAIVDAYSVIGIFKQEPKKVIDEIKNKYLNKNNINESNVEKLIESREQYKINKDYESADKIRQTLINMGIIINDREKYDKWDIDFSKTTDKKVIVKK